MKKLGKEMIEYFGGLPLAITVLGGLLATKQTREGWEDVHKHVKSYLHGEQNLRVNKVLALSYNDLPSHLKPCFLYLGHFPEDFEIPTKELIRMWMGEGFISQIQHGGGREDTMDDVGDRYLRELVQRCMVLVENRGSLGRIKTCRIHDLMRDFCVSKAQEENFLHFTNILSMKQREVQIGKVRRLAIIPKSGDNYIEGVKFKEYPYLRSLLHFMPSRNYSQFKESCFKKFKLVRVLYLENLNKDNKKLPKDNGCLIHLRYLSLKDSNINKVPSSIGNLRCLETIDLRIHSDDSYEPIVPNVFKYMKQLKHLYLPYVYRVRFELELSNLSYLQSLASIDPKTIQIPTWFKLSRLQLLIVRINKQAQDATQILQILISRCPHLEKLNIFKPMKKLPEPHQFSPYLFKLILWGTNLEADPMPTLEKLPNLKLLRLFGSFFQMKNMACSERGFLVLQTLVIGFCDNLEQWRVEEGAMPSLSHLTIDSCQSLKTIPDELRFITTLKELEIKHMPKSFKDRLHEGGPDFYKVQHVQRMVIRFSNEFLHI